MNLKVDPNRHAHAQTWQTGIFVRAQRGDNWESVDIIELDADSLVCWLRSRGGKNLLAENVVGILLGHGNIVLEMSNEP